MTTIAVALLSGLIFGVGLLLAGMTNPYKVQAFLDLAGDWDPSLALVMVGAIAVARIGFALAVRRGRTLLNGTLHLPATDRVTGRLLAGSVLFGVGWGLAGLCPGPAVVDLGLGYLPAYPAIIGMVAGMWAARHAAGAAKTVADKAEQGNVTSPP